MILTKNITRPNHVHVMTDAPGFHKLTMALHPEGDPYPSRDDILDAKKSLAVVNLHHLPVGIACAPVVRPIPRMCPRRFGFLFSPCIGKVRFFPLEICYQQRNLGKR